jgi:hypothetical protein
MLAGSRDGRASRVIARGRNVWVLFLAGAACLAGCGSGGNHAEPGTGASAYQHPILENVPLPGGFQLVDDHSVGMNVGRTRVGKFEFRGEMERARVGRFYKEFMPSGGWTLLSEDFDRGVHTMRYESPSEECYVRLRTESRKTIISVQVQPLSRGGAEREARAPSRPR